MKAIISIGLPGCGKTTLLKPLAKKEGLKYLNADDIREELTGDPADHTKEGAVWKLMYGRIKKALEKGGVVVDVTNSKRRDRKRMVKFCRANGADEIIAYWFKIPLKVCLQRNEKRQRIVEPEVIKTMSRRLRTYPPIKNEGFDKIVRITG